MSKRRDSLDDSVFKPLRERFETASKVIAITRTVWQAMYLADFIESVPAHPMVGRMENHQDQYLEMSPSNILLW